MTKQTPKSPSSIEAKNAQQNTSPFEAILRIICDALVALLFILDILFSFLFGIIEVFGNIKRLWPYHKIVDPELKLRNVSNYDHFLHKFDLTIAPFSNVADSLTCWPGLPSCNNVKYTSNEIRNEILKMRDPEAKETHNRLENLLVVLDDEELMKNLCIGTSKSKKVAENELNVAYLETICELTLAMNLIGLENLTFYDTFGILAKNAKLIENFNSRPENFKISKMDEPKGDTEGMSDDVKKLKRNVKRLKIEHLSTGLTTVVWFTNKMNFGKETVVDYFIARNSNKDSKFQDILDCLQFSFQIFFDFLLNFPKIAFKNVIFPAPELMVVVNNVFILPEFSPIHLAFMEIMFFFLFIGF